MENSPKSRILGLGTYLPHRKLINHDLGKIVDTRRTGVKERRMSEKEEHNSSLTLREE